MNIKSHILILLTVVLATIDGIAQPRSREERPVMPLRTDSTVVDRKDAPMDIKESDQVKMFYDSLRSKTSGSGFSRFIYHSFFRNPDRESELYDGQVVDERERYERFEGKTIGEILVWRDKTYDKNAGGIRKFMNRAHALTTEGTIRRDLLFKKGDKVDPDLIVNNNQLLRSRTYIASAEIYLMPRYRDTTMVDIIVSTQDKWTISLDGAWRNKGRTMVEVYDANLFGWGNRLSVKTHFDRSNFDYHGNLFRYDIPNLAGTFYRVRLLAGKAFEDKQYGLSLRKDFIRPTDYDLGFSVLDEQKKYYQLYADSSIIVKYREIGLWGGKSFYIKPLKSSIFATSHYERRSFRKRPTDPELLNGNMNPAFHNRDDLLFGLGLYRERFYTSNMIFGFGNIEYLAAGYKTELVGGYSWGEFSNDIYLGVNLKKGGFSSMGYFMGRGTLGSYIDSKTGTWTRSAIDVDLRWISNLWTQGSSRVRQFLTLTYTHGWNRWKGNDEVITYTLLNGPSTIDEWLIGTTRMVFNTETVVFTPLQPLGFRMALFGFADVGLLGFKNNIFDNPFCTTIGFGVRFKNERFIFKTIQLRFGIAFGKGGIIQNQWMRLSNEQRMRQYRFIPSHPEVVEFK